MCPPAGPPLGTAEPDRGPVSRVLQPRTEKDMDPNTVEGPQQLRCGPRAEWKQPPREALVLKPRCPGFPARKLTTRERQSWDTPGGPVVKTLI